MNNNQPVRRIESLLALVGNGQYLRRLHSETAQHLRDLEDHVTSEKRDASMTLTIKLKVTLDRTGLARLTADHDFKDPKVPASMGVAFLNDGQITPQNPAQMRFDLRDAAMDAEIVDDMPVAESRFAD